MRIFTVPFNGFARSTYLQMFEKHKELNTKLGFYGSLIFTSSNDPFEPFTLAQWLCEGNNLIPLVALNPGYSHPYSAAWKVLSLSTIYKRPVAINWVTGASKSELSKLGDNLTKKERYERLIEFYSVFNSLLNSNIPVNHSGKYYELQNAQFSIKLQHKVEHFLAGESEFAIEAVKAIGANHMVMGNECSTYEPSVNTVSIGLIIEERANEAIERANDLFKETALNLRTLDFISHNSDSDWKRRLINEIKPFEKEGYTANSLLKQGESPFIVGSKSFVTKYLSNLKNNGIQSIVATLTHAKDYTMLAQIKNELNW
jgi:alkanesulfonate monooxygenase